MSSTVKQHEEDYIHISKYFIGGIFYFALVALILFSFVTIMYSLDLETEANDKWFYTWAETSVLLMIIITIIGGCIGAILIFGDTNQKEPKSKRIKKKKKEN